ncbi:unnamed protein product [Tilletia laevis]|uniref:Uncharacterized protein n=1 Tax=Tilletia laevis TaxID=157183 RepID=A0A9N8QJ80_9BASI|nr:unnamed protein product [Tilletia laevis]
MRSATPTSKSSKPSPWSLPFSLPSTWATLIALYWSIRTTLRSLAPSRRAGWRQPAQTRSSAELRFTKPELASRSTSGGSTQRANGQTPRPAASSRPTSPASLSRAWMQSWASASGRAGSRGQPAGGGDGEDPPEKKGRAPERGHAVRTKVLKTAKPWCHLLEDWKENSIKTRTPQTRPGRQELTYVPHPSCPNTLVHPHTRVQRSQAHEVVLRQWKRPALRATEAEEEERTKQARELPHPGRADGRPS